MTLTDCNAACGLVAACLLALLGPSCTTPYYGDTGNADDSWADGAWTGPTTSTTDEWTADTYEVRCGPGPIGNPNKRMCLVPGEVPPYPGATATGPFLIDQVEYNSRGDDNTGILRNCEPYPGPIQMKSIYSTLDPNWVSQAEADPGRVGEGIAGPRPSVVPDKISATWRCGCEGKRVPTACEWTTAAMGTDGRQYVYGNTYRRSWAVVAEPYRADLGCWQGFRPEWREEDRVPYPNFPEDAGLGCMTPWPVASIPEDVSPYGVYDMGGNVSELIELPPDWMEDPASHCAQSLADYPPPEYAEKVFTMGSNFALGVQATTDGILYLLGEQNPEFTSYSYTATYSNTAIGFRCVVGLDELDPVLAHRVATCFGPDFNPKVPCPGDDESGIGGTDTGSETDGDTTATTEPEVETDGAETG